jgi:toxin ParE1/3/4
MCIRVAPQARADLDAIWLYIARESGSRPAATRVITWITDKFRLFARFPHVGRSLESELRPNVRIFPIGSYLIFYSIKSGEVRILRIIHASRDALAVFTAE